MAPSERPKSTAQGIAWALIGAGLVLLGIVAGIVLLPQLASSFGQVGYTYAVPETVDYPAPALELTDLQGNPVSLAGLRGKVVLVNLWATWCPPCRTEMPTLDAYYRAHKHQDFLVVAIDSQESAETTADFLADRWLAFPVWPDPSGAAMQAFQVESYPNTFVLNAQGQVVLRWGGPASSKMLEQYITPLLEQ